MEKDLLSDGSKIYFNRASGSDPVYTHWKQKKTGDFLLLIKVKYLD